MPEIKANSLRKYREQLVSYKTAILAKEKGFDWKSMYSYVHWSHEDDMNGELISQKWWEDDFNTIKAPNIQLLQKWLREEYLYHVYALPEQNEWYYTILKLPSPADIAFAESGECQDGDLWLKDEQVATNIMDDNGAKTFEEAVDLGSQEALKLIPK